MGVPVPRITLHADYDKKSWFGELSLISFGFGLHQAWVYSTMFATPEVFGTAIFAHGLYGSYASLTYLISIFVYTVCLLFASATHQRFLHTYVSKKLLVVAAIILCLGSLILVLPLSMTDQAMLIIEIISGIFTGFGSSMLILYWGVAFARCDPDSIVLNSTIAIVVGVAFYALLVRYLPFPASGLVVAAIPLIELAILLRKTPEPFYKRSMPPAFNPLKVNRVKFAIQLGAPVLVLGLALGWLRQTPFQTIFPATSLANQGAVLFASLCAAVLILITLLALGGSTRWSRLFRPLIPFVALAIVLLPFAGDTSSIVPSIILLVAYICFEALMWIFFGELSQRFKISPLFVFGFGRGLLASAMLLGSIANLLLPSDDVSMLPLGEGTLIFLLLLVMVIAYALLPDERDIKHVIAPCPAISAILNDNKATYKMPSPIIVSGTQQDSINNTVEAQMPADSISTNSLVQNAQPNTEESSAHSDNSTELEATHKNKESDQKTPNGIVSEAQSNTVQNAGNADMDTGAHPSPARKAMYVNTISPSNNADTAENSSSKLSDGHLGDTFRKKCEFIASHYLLSKREAEVMTCLARGLNASSIQEKLFISEGTAKTHIRHVYRKLDIHTQQELIRRVEDAPTG